MSKITESDSQNVDKSISGQNSVCMIGMDEGSPKNHKEAYKEKYLQPLELYTEDGRRVLGVDLGIRTLITASNGERYLEKALPKKSKKYMNAIFENIIKTVEFFFENFDVICVESIDINEMQKDTTLTKWNAWPFWNAFYEAIQKEPARIVFIGKYYPSSKKCFHCGNINHELPRGTIRWRCPNCRLFLDRDMNAARNIAFEGARVYNKLRENKKAG